jgi:hypothetical protein
VELRVYYATAGGHVHCRVFTASAAHLPFAKSGDLVFSVAEWPAALALLTRIADVRAEPT